jgi:RNA polymerase sigma-70 factor (ECF subfamily)
MTKLPLTLCVFVHIASLPAVAQIRRAEPEWTVESAPPVVVKTEPIAGSINIDAHGTTEIRVTFSKSMLDGSWSWVKASDATFPEKVEKPRFDHDGKTCVLPVTLQPGKTYALWINDAKARGFMDTRRTPAVPYLLVFQTQSDASARKRR